MFKIETTLPSNVKSGGVDNSVLYLVNEETGFLSNSDVFPDPTEELILTLNLTNETQVNLRGVLTGSTLIDLPNGTGIDYIHSFVAKQHKVTDDEPDFSGIFKGTLQFSKFKWALKSLESSTDSEYDTAQANFVSTKEQLDPTKTTVRTLLENGTALGNAGNYKAAIEKLTAALSIDLRNEDPEAAESEDVSKERLEILAKRSKYSFELKAFRASKRDCELIERIYGQPIEAIHSLEAEEGPHYFDSMLRKAQALELLGFSEQAAHGYLAIMILKALSEGDVKPESGPPVSNAIAESLTTQASEYLKKMENDPNQISILTLKIELQDVDSPVWRSLEVTADSSLAELREYILCAMGWCGGQDNEFNVNDHGIVKFTTIPEEAFEEDSDSYDEYEDESYVNITEVLESVGESLSFIYEGKWIHKITLERVCQEIIKEEEEENLSEYPKCIAGERACPPEELGPEGYRQFLRSTQNNEKTEKFEGRIKALEFAVENIGFTNNALDSWGGIKGKVHSLKDGKEVEATKEEEGDPSIGGWNPDAFSIEEVNESLASLVGIEEWEDDEENEIEE
ncbi:hypothetical protein HK096_008151 [Nowakowskiella sp. JEL0078]|nr:hypothetical protein HK096_008151 [Nowakowskiella sp. JEL0078]